MENTAQPSRPPLRALVVSTFCLYFGFGLISPVLPLFARDLGARSWLVGLTVAGFGIASFCFDIAGGRLARRIGVRRAAAAGALVVCAASALGAAAPTTGVLLLSRLISGAGSAVYVTTAMNILARTTPAERMGRAMSAYQGAILLGAAFGPAAGGLVAGASGYRLPFLIYAGMTAVSAAVSLRALPDTLPAPAPKLSADGAAADERTAGFRDVLRDGAFLTALLVAFVVFILRQGVNSTAVPLYAQDVLGLSKGQIGVALTVSALSNFLLLAHAGRLADRRPRGVAIAVGLVATLVSLGLLGWWQSTPGLYLAMAVMGCATAYAGVTPAAVIADVTPPAHSATAMGVYRMAIDAGQVVGPLAVGVLAGSIGHADTFLTLALPAALALVAVLRLRDTRRPVVERGPAPAPRHAGTRQAG